MTAKEMFEEMGFEIEQDNERYLIYTQVINHDDYDDVEINKVIFDKRQYLVSSKNQNHYIPISFCVLQAISKQIEELMEINDKEIKIDANSIQIGNKVCYCVDKDLIDYIINLQQDLDKANDIIEKDRQFYKCRMDEYAELKKENERLKEEVINVRNFIKLRNVNTETEDKALLYNLQLENINKIRYLDYKSRCEKAIEYIKEHWVIDEPIKFKNDLSNILNGSDEK